MYAEQQLLPFLHSNEPPICQAHNMYQYSVLLRKRLLGFRKRRAELTSAKVLYPVASEWQAGRWKLVEAAQHGPCVALKHLVQVNGDAHGFMDGASSSAMCWV